MTEDITGIAVSTCPDLSHYPPLFQLKSSEVFIKSPEVSIKSSEVSTKSSGLFLYLFPTKQKSAELFAKLSRLSMFTCPILSRKVSITFSCSARCLRLTSVG